MKESLIGYVVYGKIGKKHLPIGVISSDYKRKATPIKIPLRMKYGLIAIEDKRFYDHFGLDYKGIARAIRNNVKAKKIVEGGSTITQQLARNLLCDFEKTITRKIKEAFYSLYLESRYSKENIISKYFENVYWGKNIYGLRAASIYYFCKEPYKLSEQEQIMLLTLLRGPNLYCNNISIALKRYNLLNEILYKNDIIKSTHYHRNISTPPIFKKTELSIINQDLAPYICNKIDTNKRTIASTIDIELQKILNEYVENAPFTVSIVAVKNGKLSAIASSLGTNYPLNFKANVGSTLKPFIYQFLRENGIGRDELFCSIHNDLGWHVHEATAPEHPYLTLEQGLLISNNNVFLNAAAKIGTNNTLDYLSRKLGIDRNEIYPSTILGATNCGMSLVDLTLLYDKHFSSNINSYTKELFSILNKNAISHFGSSIGNEIFLKTGTTNESKECYVILGKKDLVFGILKNKDNVSDYRKGTTLINYTKKNNKILKTFFTRKTAIDDEYEWL